MSGYLKYRISRSVDDRLARPDVLLAKLLNDLGPARRHITEHSRDSCLSDKAVEDPIWEAIWKSGKRLLQNDPCHFPVARRRILAVGLESALAVRADRAVDGGYALER